MAECLWQPQWGCPGNSVRIVPAPRLKAYDDFQCFLPIAGRSTTHTWSVRQLKMERQSVE